MTFSLLLAAAATIAQPTDSAAQSGSMDQVDVAFEELADGRNRAAIEQMRNSDLVKAGDPAALINLGTAYALIGETEKAREYFEAAQASEDRYLLQLADGKWVDSRRAARMAAKSLTSTASFATR